MNQRPSVDNLKQFTHQTAQLNPQLQAVLGNLDVQLDDELARYRRKKRSEAEAPQPSGYRHRSTTPKNLEVVVTPGQRETPATRSHEPLPFDHNGSEAIASDFREANESNTFSSGLSPFSPQVNLPQKLEASLSSNRSNVGDRDAASSNITNSITNINLAENNAPNSTEESPERTQAQPHDYLESSAQLLSSLNESSASDLSTRLRNRRRQRRSLKNLLSPLSVGATLLFVLTTGTLGYIINAKIGARQPVVTAENAASSATSSASSPTQTPLPVVPRSPNLADREFVPLDLDTLGTINHNSGTKMPAAVLPTVPTSPAPEPTQTTAIIPEVPRQNYPSLENLNTAILPQSVQDNLPNARANSSNNANSNNANSNNANSGNNSPQANSGASSPTPAATNQTPGTQTPQKLPEPKVSTQSFPAFFYVVIDYQNEDSLYQARQVIPDAYVREFPIGVKVQMAAFEDTASAQAMVQYLKEKGFVAQVYQP